MTNTKKLSFGAFWVISSDSKDFESYKLLCFTVLCDESGTVIRYENKQPPLILSVFSCGESGKDIRRTIEIPNGYFPDNNEYFYNVFSYAHKNNWDENVKNDSAHEPYNEKDYDYYPRGRVEILPNMALISLHPDINRMRILDDIKTAFGLHDIGEVRIEECERYVGKHN